MRKTDLMIGAMVDRILRNRGDVGERATATMEIFAWIRTDYAADEFGGGFETA